MLVTYSPPSAPSIVVGKHSRLPEYAVPVADRVPAAVASASGAVGRQPRSVVAEVEGHRTELPEALFEGRELPCARRREDGDVRLLAQARDLRGAQVRLGVIEEQRRRARVERLEGVLVGGRADDVHALRREYLRHRPRTLGRRIAGGEGTVVLFGAGQEVEQDDHRQHHGADDEG
ncbi:hypothetical protein MN0502_22340 [Arthrobacter sp. MN05-02]|nr:hypothetical protein MN0502_22340 [Arthrobacter sp. MN05-02]